MKLMIGASALAAAAFATVAVAAPPSPLGPPPASGAALSAEDCILERDIRNHSVVDKNTLLLDVWRQGTYRVTMRNGCFKGAISADPIGLRIKRSKICKPRDLQIDARSGHCDVASIVKLAPAEVAALPRKLKP